MIAFAAGLLSSSLGSLLLRAGAAVLLVVCLVLGVGVYSLKKEASSLNAALVLVTSERDLARADVRLQLANVAGLRAAADAQAVRLRDAEDFSAELMAIAHARPLAPAPKGCAPAVSWARSAETKEKVLDAWRAAQ